MTKLFGKKEEDPFDPNFHIDDYFHRLKFFLRLTAMWPIPKLGESLFRKILYFFYIIFLHAMIWHMIMVLVLDTNKKMKDGLHAVTYNIANTILYFMTSVTMLYFQIRTDSIQEFINDFNKSMHARSAIGLDFVTTEASYRLVNKVTNIWTLMILFGGHHQSLFPVITWQRILPIGGAYPFDVSVFPYYEIAYLMQLVAQTILCLTFTNFGNFYMSVCLYFCSQYDLLACSLKNLRNTALLEKGINERELSILKQEYFSRDSEANEYYEVKVFKEDLSSYPNIGPIIPADHVIEEKKKTLRDHILNFDLNSIARYIQGPIISNSVLKKKDNYQSNIDHELNRAIGQCVEHHLKILSLIKRLESLTSPILLIKAIQVSLFMCMAAFTIATVLTSGDIWVWNLLEYLSGSSADMFTFCYSGQLITMMSQRVRYAISRSDWRLFGGSARRSMSIVLQASSRPITLTGGKFYEMNLMQFRFLMSASFSYYTLLKNMQN